MKQAVKSLLDLKINDFNENLLKQINKFFSSPIVNTAFNIKPFHLTKQRYNSKEFKSSTRNKKLLFSILYKQWGKSSDVIDNTQQFLKKIIACDFLSELEKHEGNLILKKIKEVKKLNQEKNINIKRIKEVILLFINEIKIKVKSGVNSNVSVSGLLETRALDYRYGNNKLS